MKIQKTFTIDKDIWEKYHELSKKRSYNKSLQIENFMKDIISIDEDPDNFVLYGNIKILSYKKSNGDVYKINQKNDSI